MHLLTDNLRHPIDPWTLWPTWIPCNNFWCQAGGYNLISLSRRITYPKRPTFKWKQTSYGIFVGMEKIKWVDSFDLKHLRMLNLNTHWSLHISKKLEKLWFQCQEFLVKSKKHFLGLEQNFREVPIYEKCLKPFNTSNNNAQSGSKHNSNSKAKSNFTSGHFLLSKKKTPTDLPLHEYNSPSSVFWTKFFRIPICEVPMRP